MRVYYIIVAQFLFHVYRIKHVSGGDVKLTKCPQEFPQGNNYLTLDNLRIQDCDAQPCMWEKSKAYTFEGTGVLHDSTTMLNVDAYIHIPPLPPINVLKLNVCEYLSKNACANITAGTVITDKRIWKLDSSFPSGQGILRVVLLSDLNQPKWCRQISVILKGDINIPGFEIIPGAPAG